MKILAVGVMIVGFGLMFWFIRLSYRIRAEYRPPFGIAGPFEFLRLDFYSDQGRAAIAKAACALVLLSFVFVGMGITLSALPPSGQPVGREGKALPPDIFAFVPAAMFHVTALVAAIGLLLGAAFQLLSSWLSPPGNPRRKKAMRLAIYGGAASLVAIAHFILMKVGPGLLK